jgi:MtfA peptidase
VRCVSTQIRSGRNINQQGRRQKHSWHGRPEAPQRGDDSFQAVFFEGFENPWSKDNVGVHEFAHLVENEEVEHGLPPEVPWQAVKHWVQYVARELSHPPKNGSYINKYAYTNEHEFFAVLAEYFFKSPDLLQEKDPQLYAMLREMFYQDTRSLLQLPSSGRQHYGRNAACPCGSGKKYKHCCLLKAVEARARGEKAA